MHLGSEQVEQFRGQGYLNIGRVFSDAEVEEIRGEYDRLVTPEAQTLGNDEDGRYPYRAMLSFRSAVHQPPGAARGRHGSCGAQHPVLVGPGD